MKLRDAKPKPLNRGCIDELNCGLIDSMTLDEAIKEFGSINEIAAILDISVQAVYRWRDEVPPLRVYQLRDKIAEKHSKPVEAAA